MDWITLETKAGKSVTAGNQTLTPLAQSLHIKLPGTRGWLAWSRPVSVVVQSTNDQERVLPIQDVTFATICLILGAGLLGGLLTLLFWRHR